VLAGGADDSSQMGGSARCQFGLLGAAYLPVLAGRCTVVGAGAETFYTLYSPKILEDGAMLGCYLSQFSP